MSKCIITNCTFTISIIKILRKKQSIKKTQQSKRSQKTYSKSIHTFLKQDYKSSSQQKEKQ